jgi:hypothetical protein
MTPGNIAQLKPSADALEYLKTKVCPGKTAGYNSSIPASQLKEQYVYFSYPNSSGSATSMSVTALACFQNAVKAMESAGLQPCIVAALRSPLAQSASCNDRNNSIVCGRTSGGGCSGSYGNCPHVKGMAMDFNDKTTCSGARCSISQTFANKMRQDAAAAGARATVANDLPHLECNGAGAANIPNGGITGPATGGGTGNILGNNGLMQNLGNRRNMV